LKPTVLLFDIDGTLITTGGAGRRAMERAFEVAHQRADALSAIRLDGMTDRLIARLGLDAIGVKATDAAIDGLLASYLTVLAEEVARIEDARYRLHLGMTAAIDAAHARGCAVGLGTGNLREGARVKLERVGVWQRFSFGGFGDDHEDRAALIRRGAERGAAALGVPLSGARVVIIGDTPKDVAAALAMGAESIGVATGSFTAEQLLASGATRAFATLADHGAVDALLGV
jgi:phosphoglycolate phosphatase